MVSSALTPFLCKVVTAIIDPLILLLSAAAFVYFIWGVARFILATSQGENADEYRSHMFWGIVGLAIIFGAYGIINLALGTFGLGSYSGPGCSAPATVAAPSTTSPF
jgi:hypothetical protein